MLHIILMILKIIGILLLVLLLLVLAVTGAVLFVPVRYRVNGKKDGDGLLIRAEAFWFLHLLRIKAVYPEPGRTVIKLLCFTLYDSDAEKPPEKEPGKKEKGKRKKKEQTKKIKSKRDKTARKESEGTVFEGGPFETIPDKGRGTERSDTGKTSADRDKETEKERKTDSAESGQALEEWKEQEETEENEGIFYRILRAASGLWEKTKDILRKIKKAAANIWYTIKRLCDRIVKMRENIGYYIEVFEEEETKRAFSICRKELNKIWKNIRPTKCRAELLLGTGEPDTTGYILAVYGILYPIIGNDIIIEPDFENQVLEGKLFLKGRITVYVLLYAVIKIYFDKNIRYFLKRFKREEI